jgi:hypothetical protein
VSRRVVLTRAASRQLSEERPESTAAALWELIPCDLRDAGSRSWNRMRATRPHLAEPIGSAIGSTTKP